MTTPTIGGMPGSAEQMDAPWPEHAPPTNVHADCSALGMEGHGRFVWGEGQPASRTMFVLDNPGAREDRDGQPFVCGTRQTLRCAARDAGLHCDRLYITYLVKCRPLRAYDKALARRIGASLLQEQVNTMRPEMLVLFGDVVVQTLTGDDRASVRALRGASLNIFDTDAIVAYHPLAARRRPNLYPLLVQDLRRVLTR